MLESVIVSQFSEHVGECGIVDQPVDRQNPRGKLSHAPVAQPADEILGKHRQWFLQFVIARQPAAQLAELLRFAIIVGDDMSADFVTQ